MVRLIVISMVALWPLLAPALADPCGSDSDHGSFSGTDIALIHGETTRLSVNDRWTLTFEPHQYGWQLRLRDANGLDLSQITPPAHGPNPRDLFGWHFRNAANSGPNTGDVNAPQHLRRFLFSPALAGTGGFKPSGGGSTMQDATAGTGTLALRKVVLTPVAPGGTAAMLRARADVCLTWPQENGASLHPDALELWARCGLDLGVWTPQHSLTPAILGGDFDGDGAGDEAVILRSTGNGQPALAICRAQTWLDILPVGEILPQGTLAQAEGWHILANTHGPLGYVDEPPWPAADGDLIALERFEKSLSLLYRENGSWQVQRVYRSVTAESE